jgi:CheY-like chemotaxis protein
MRTSKVCDATQFVSSNILIAEDIPINYDFLSSLLEHHPFSLTWAKDGLEAVKYAESNAYDLILMDINMPNMDGVEATQKIRQMQRNRDIPIIALTANALTGDRERFLKAGMDDYIAKPFNEEALHILLEKYIGHRK